jgi:hypothetical protein
MGEGTSTEDFVDICLAGNVIFPVMLMEALVAGKFLRPGGRPCATGDPAEGKWRSLASVCVQVVIDAS